MDAAAIREAVFAAEDSQREPVEVPEWGVTVYVRSLTANERDDFERSVMRVDPRTGKPNPNLSNVRARLLVKSVVDEHGERVFSHDGDVTELGKRNSKPVDRLFTKAQELSGLTQEDVDKLEGNSESDHSDGSYSDSR